MIPVELMLYAELLILLIMAKVSGEALARLGYPTVLGEILVGLFLGPSILGLIAPQESLRPFVDLGFLFILLYAGLSIKPEEFFKECRRGAIICATNVAATMILGYSIGRFFGYPEPSSLSIGMALALSSVGLGVRVLMDLKRLGTLVGTTIVSVAAIDNVSEILLLGALLGMVGAGGGAALSQLASQIIKTILFFSLIFIFGFKLKILQRLKKPFERMKTPGSKFSYTLFVMFASVCLAYLSGLQAVVGALFAGLMLSGPFKHEKEVKEVIRTITFGLFAPIAFLWVGLNTPLTALSTNLPLLFAIIAAGVGGEIVGGSLGARIMGFKWRDSLIIGLGLTGRAGMELVVADVLRRTGLIAPEVYASIVILTSFACIFTPISMRLASKHIWQ